MREGYLGYKKFHMRADDTADLVLMRAAEMYLIEAEAKVRDGVALAQAVAPLNTLRNARGVGDYEVTGKSQEDVINEILMERRRELWGEGFGITDILRTQKAVERAALSDEMQKTEVDCWQEGGSFEKRNPLGHWFLNFPNGKPFTVNSTYYLYASLPLFQWMREGYLGYKKFHMRADDTADLVLMRAAEMYLIETEAKVRDGVALAQAVAPLNTLRNARGVGDYEVTGKSQEDVINEILMERRRELWGEGFGITDILRTQKAVERAALSDEMQKTEVDCWQEGGSFEKRNPLGHWFLNFPNGKPFTVNSTYYLYAIPQKEINANPNI